MLYLLLSSQASLCFGQDASLNRTIAALNLTLEQRDAVEAGAAALSWSVGSGILAFLACCAFGLFPGFWILFDLLLCRPCADLTALSLQGDYEADYSLVQEEGQPRGEQLLTLEKPSALGAETRLACLQPMVMGLLWLALGLLLGKAPPAWLQLPLLLLPVLRACRADACLVRACVDEGASLRQLAAEDVTRFAAKPLPFFFSKLEVADATTDGLAIATVYLLERDNDLFRTRLLAAWGAGPAARLMAPLLLRRGLWAAMLAVQALACLFQAAVARSDKNEVMRALHADMAGLGGLAVRLPEGKDAKLAVALKLLAKTLYEAAPQLFLQSSCVIAAGKGLMAQPTLLLSLALSVLLLAKKGLEMARNSPLCVPGGCLVLGLAALVLLRLLLSERCEESLLFDLSSWRCVPAPLPP